MSRIRMQRKNTLSPEQEQERRRYAKQRQYNRDRDKLLKEGLQDIDADLAGRTYLAYDELFKDCDEETVKLLIAGDLKGLISKDLKKERDDKIRLKRKTKK